MNEIFIESSAKFKDHEKKQLDQFISKLLAKGFEFKVSNHFFHYEVDYKAHIEIDKDLLFKIIPDKEPCNEDTHTSKFFQGITGGKDA